MITVDDRARRIRESAHKIQKPFELDETLCLYSPQDNVDSLAHPRIAEWLEFVETKYEPDLPEAERRVLLFLPCTKTKPYPFSSEHQAINKRLLAEGFRPTGELSLPPELVDRLGDDMPKDVLNLAILSDGKGTIIHRMIISEPMAVVPYEHIVSFNGKASPATAYDDPGLFENRGNAVSPWRADSTAEQISASRWRWGPEEKRAYVAMHNAMAEGIAKVVGRIGERYTDIVSWVAPGLTHRSFVLAKGERSANKVAARRKVGDEFLALAGANDTLGPDGAIECLPTLEQCRDAIERLATRLGSDIEHATAVYARGGANATPLALPELLDVLVARIKR
ncbi:hypothetical protein [Amorphus sp. 3PC139-8]|uniref:hypothetical protein n=1 Tax=Amorphus sp. 3PC139-8 TaxID=2735676 RepID=UPI00345D4C17